MGRAKTDAVQERRTHVELQSIRDQTAATPGIEIGSAAEANRERRAYGTATVTGNGPKLRSSAAASWPQPTSTVPVPAPAWAVTSNA